MTKSAISIKAILSMHHTYGGYFITRMHRIDITMIM